MSAEADPELLDLVSKNLEEEGYLYKMRVRLPRNDEQNHCQNWRILPSTGTTAGQNFPDPRVAAEPPGLVDSY